MSRYAALILTAIVWGSAFPAITAALAGYAPGHLVLLRFLIASTGMSVLWLVRGRPLPARADLPRIMVVALLGFTIYPFIVSAGQRTVDPGTASVLVNLSPIFTAILAALTIGERLNAVGWIGVAVAFAGATLAALRNGNGNPLTFGVALILLAAIVQALQFVGMKTLLRRYDAVSLTIFCVFGGTAADLLFAPGLLDAMIAAPRAATFAVAWLGLTVTAAATMLWSYGLARVPAPVAASFLYIVPGVSILVAWLWLGEVPAARTVIGAAIAVIGVAIVKRSVGSSPALAVGRRATAALGK